MESPNDLKRRARRIERELARLYPQARCSLDFQNPFQLLVATILSAQCTDARVNQVTPALFARFPDAAALADANPAEVEELIQSTGFYRNKAANLIRCAQQLRDNHQGQVPKRLDALVQLAGVGRKTANVIRGNAFGIPGLPVDTHVSRLSRRMGLTQHEDAVKIEADLTALIPRSKWTIFGLRMIYHGRAICDARKPACLMCPLQKKLCPQIDVKG
jgi:endonuclease-3